jgi:hypothetical protein
MCKECGCGISNKKDPGYGKGPAKKKAAAKKAAAKKAAPKKKK